MISGIIWYIILAVITALGFSATKSGHNVGTKKCLIYGIFWPASILLTIFAIGLTKLREKIK
jgi:hypothetical protein